MVEMRGVEPLQIANLAGILSCCVQIRVRIFFVLQKISKNLLTLHSLSAIIRP